MKKNLLLLSLFLFLGMVHPILAQNAGTLTVSTTNLNTTLCLIPCSKTSPIPIGFLPNGTPIFNCVGEGKTRFPVIMSPIGLSFGTPGVSGSSGPITYTNNNVVMDNNGPHFTIGVDSPIYIDGSTTPSATRTYGYKGVTIQFSDAIMPSWTNSSLSQCYGNFTFSNFVPVFSVKSAYASECVNGKTKLATYPSNKGSDGNVVAQYGNWQFSVDQGLSWINFASAYNQKESPEFKIYDLLKASNIDHVNYINKPIQFRLGDPNKLGLASFTVTPITINYKTCEPIAQNIYYKNPACDTNTTIPEIQVEFNRPLNANESVASLTIADTQSPNQILVTATNVTYNNTIYSFTGDNLLIDDNHTYIIKSQCKIQIDANTSYMEPLVTNSLIYYTVSDNGRKPMVHDTNDELGTSTLTATKPNPITITGTAENATKIGTPTNGKITLTVIGGTPICTDNPYHYTWTKDGLALTNPNLTALGKGTYKVVVKDKYGCSAEQTFIITEPDPIAVTLDPPAKIACNGKDTGTLSVKEVTGGYGDVTKYTYQWFNVNDRTNAIFGKTTPTITGLPKGTYFVTITDEGGNTQNAADMVLGENDAITASNLPTNVKCNGGTDGAVSLNITGGTPPYTVNWLDGAITQDRTNLTAGSYSYTIIDALGCKYNNGNSTPVTIEEPAVALTLASFQIISATTSNPNGGAITVNPVGGTLPNQTESYQYVWTKTGDPSFANTDYKSITGLANGEYQVVVTAPSGCKIEKTFVLAELSVVEIVAQHVDVLCYGEKTGVLTAEGKGGTLLTDTYTYQ